MQPEDRDLSYVEDMLRYAREAQSFSAGKTYEDYLRDRQLQLAVERAIEVVGEVGRRDSPVFRQAHPEIPWVKILGQRNVLAQEYGEIDPALMWGLVRKHLPELIARLERLLESA